MNRTRLLFVVNGHGLGNATRCHAIMEQLPWAQIKVLCSGRAQHYFAQELPHLPLIGLKQLRPFPKMNLAWPFLFVYVSWCNLFWSMANGWKLLQECLRFKPKLVVTDSFYTLLPLAWAFHFQVWSINNAVVVVKNARKIFSSQKISVIAHFLRIEFWDFLYHHFFSTKVFVPSPMPKALSHKHYVSTPLIVRQELFPASTSEKDIILFLSSGSADNTTIHLTCPSIRQKMVVVGPSFHPHGDDSLQIQYYSADLGPHDLRKLLERTLVAVSHGGMSTLSELHGLGIPILIFPLPHHSEQWVNASLFGRASSVQTFSADLLQALALAPKLKRQRPEGAIFFANKISAYISGGEGRAPV